MTAPQPLPSEPPAPPRDSACSDANRPSHLDPDDWFGDPKFGPGARARTICMSVCPSRQQCLDYVMSWATQPPGIWAGLTYEERLRLRRLQQDRRPPPTRASASVIVR